MYNPPPQVARIKVIKNRPTYHNPIFDNCIGKTYTIIKCELGEYLLDTSKDVEGNTWWLKNEIEIIK